MLSLSLPPDNLDPVPSSVSTSPNDSPSKTPIPFSMSGDGTDDITIPAVFMKKSDASVLRDLLQLEKSVYILLTWIPGLESGMGMGQKEGEASKGKEDMVNSVDSDEESRSGLYDSGMGTSESDYNQQHRDSAQTCSSTADCNSPSDSP